MLSLSDTVKRVGEKLAGDAPSAAAPSALIRTRKPHLFHFADDGATPNNVLPLVLYRSPIALRDYSPAAILEALFASHGWGDAWRDGIYAHNHFHTRTHEVIGIARGDVRVRYGGAKGRVIALKAGDVVIHPAGVGHERVGASRDLLVVGAYPSNAGRYDEPSPRKVAHEEALARIARVKRPLADPVYGKNGPLLAVWRAAAR